MRDFITKLLKMIFSLIIVFIISIPLIIAVDLYNNNINIEHVFSHTVLHKIDPKTSFYYQLTIKKQGNNELIGHIYQLDFKVDNAYRGKYSAKDVKFLADIVFL